ncbi:hypothetical protein PFISCL1PPCAC_887, partial [Pristionchus fissidentatus]
DAAVHAQNRTANKARERHVGENLVEHVEQLARIALRESLLQLGLEAIDAIDRLALVVPAQKQERLIELYLEQEEQHDHFDRLLAS